VLLVLYVPEEWNATVLTSPKTYYYYCTVLG
jgi:hypothetical protein